MISKIEEKESKHNFPTTLSSPCLYLLMGFNIYLGLLVKMGDATSISTILLFEVDVESFSSYIHTNLLGRHHHELP